MEDGRASSPIRPASTAQNIRSRVRRPRTARACDACRAKKNRCDDAYPCSYCLKHGIQCMTMGQVVCGRPVDSSYVKNLEDEVRRLREQKERSPSARPRTSNSPPPAFSQLHHTPHSSSREIGPRQDQSASPSPRPGHRTTNPGSGQQEVSEVNQHTRNVEFYGSSSVVALLSVVESASGGGGGGAGNGRHSSGNGGGDDHPSTAATGGIEDAAGSIVSALHNPAYSPASNNPGSTSHEQNPTAKATHPVMQDSCGPPFPDPAQCHIFVLNFFSSIHYIHPILDKAGFLRELAERGGNSDSSSPTDSSFDALYYAILSLGALVGPRDDEPVGGISNVEWSRAFFKEAVRRHLRSGMVTDLNMVQCYFILAKVCQNELNPHLAYMYIGLAVRTALAMGINRQPRSRTARNPAQMKAETRTWWGLYSLEVEMSFSMGRPDTLGSDRYHNRHFPVMETGRAPANSSSTSDLDTPEPSHCAIIKVMVDLSRIMKGIGAKIYLSDEIDLRTVDLAFTLQSELDEWTETVPAEIRPRPNPSDLVSLKSARDPQWVKRQRLVLTLRYLNLRILMFGSLLLPSSSSPNRDSAAAMMRSPNAQRGIRICIESARNTIEIIFMMYQHHDFFRTWFYNTTYVSFAASIIVVYVLKLSSQIEQTEVDDLLQVVSRAIEVLETMDECIVALKSAKLLRGAMERARRSSRHNRGALLAEPMIFSGSGVAPVMSNTRGSRQSAFQDGIIGADAHRLGGGGGGLDGSSNYQAAALGQADGVRGPSPINDPGLLLNHYWGPVNFLDVDNAMTMDFCFQFDELHGGHSGLFNM
ncbi:hypothetical protein NLU13_8935 [Sarocladium strictum]|uniref:Zn(2)-C6 fungal-type domain-containing protein n=1 Tax=Sarocladium strictum TaxID=5046 RepID=A0AA39GAL5_SARSR|nr:hypothetical protein NLU13_8935 [Sarocladium strictum]